MHDNIARRLPKVHELDFVRTKDGAERYFTEYFAKCPREKSKWPAAMTGGILSWRIYTTV